MYLQHIIKVSVHRKIQTTGLSFLSFPDI